MNGALEEKPLTIEQLTDALYHAQEIMERCLFPFVLLDETARSIFEDHEVQGTKISLGIRNAEAVSDSMSTMRTLASNVDMRVGIEDFSETDKGFSWNYKGIPIDVKIIKRKYEFINNPDQTYYWGEIFKVPNSFAKYWKARFIVQ